MRGGLVAVCAVVTILVSCARDEDRARIGAIDSAATRLDPARGAVLPLDVMPTLLDQCSRSVPRNVVGYWAPDPVIIAALEAALGPALGEAFSRAQANLDGQAVTPQHYYRQYGGIVGRWGTREVYVNGVHESYVESIADWLEEMRNRPEELGTYPVQYRDAGWWRGKATMACDGGRQFFGVTFDPASGRLGRITFNDGP